MNCSISGELPEEPIVSRKFGLLFDKPLIDCHIFASVTQFAGRKRPITATLFSENGLWDLRKLKNFCVLSPYNEDTPTNSVEFDHSGLYLTIAGSDLRVFQVGNVRSEWDCIRTLSDLSGTGKVTCAKFGPSMDRNLRTFGLPEGSDTAMES